MEVEEDKIVPPLKNAAPLLQKDRAQQEKNRKQAAALAVFEKKIADHELVMKPVSVEYGLTAAISRFSLLRTVGWIFASWSKTWPIISTPGLSCARSASETRQSCSAALANADARYAASAFAGGFHPYPSKWPRSKTFL